MSSKVRGFTLIEMIIAIVVLGVGLAGVLTAYNIAVKSSADPAVRKQALALAESMMEEVLLKTYDSPTGSISGCDRRNAEDLLDYQGYSQSPCTIDGTAIPSLSAYTVGVSVTRPATLGVLSGNDVTQITVTVSRGSESVSLTSYRTNYAQE